MLMRKLNVLVASLLLAGSLRAQQHELFHAATRFTHADTLRGSNGPYRSWWNVTSYNLHVRIQPADSSLSGFNRISYRVLDPDSLMQIDLMTPLVLDSAVQQGRSLQFRRDGNAFFVRLQAAQPAATLQQITLYYHGKPRVAKHAPWDGGIVWTRDSVGNPWIASACQGVGASIWWPNKDYQGDEPDSQHIYVTVPDTLIDVSNGRLLGVFQHRNATRTYHWFVDNPINNYDVAINIAKYIHFSDTLQGLDGPLSLDYWVLPYHIRQAHVQFRQVPGMLHCFEYWFGPFPWYKDGYKLVETPHLGMEHQSCVAYGNHYLNGYLGRDLSGTGWGLKWDFIIVHESAHEWWGNSITSKDIADMWVHESFANYAESLYTECRFGKQAGEDYVIGCRRLVRNDRPILGVFGVNKEGSEDMYYKGGNMLNTIRAVLDNDSLWRSVLRGLNRRFWHQTVNGTQIEAYMSQASGRDLSTLFCQYLTTTTLPQLAYYFKGHRLYFRWNQAVRGLQLPLKLQEIRRSLWIHPSARWSSVRWSGSTRAPLQVNRNFYIRLLRTGS